MHEYLLEAERSTEDRPTEITCKSKWYYHGANKQLIGCSLTTSTILNFVQFVVSSDDLPPELIKNLGAKHIELDSTQQKKAIGFNGSFDSRDHECYCSFESFHSEGEFITDNELLRTSLLKHLASGDALFSFTNKYQLSEDETFWLVTGRFRLTEST